MATRLPAKELQPAVRDALDRLLRGEEASRPSIVVRIVKCSTSLSDYGNLAGGYKALLDRLRDSQIIPGDDPETIYDTYDQIKVAHRKEQGTFIELTL
jgi:hypothetical protein